MTSLQPAWQLYHLRRYPMALTETLKYLAHQPECVHGHILVAFIHGKEGRKAEAVAAAQAAMKYSPDWYFPYYGDALVRYWFDDYDAAVVSLTEALRLNPTDADLFSLGANIRAVTGKPHTSLEMAEQGLQHDPRHVGCLVQKGIILFSLDRKHEAETVLREVLEIDPEQPNAQGYVGYFEVQQGRYDLALPLLRNALRDQPHWGLAQKAWREALRGQYPVYGSVARLKQWLFEVHKWRVFATTVLVCMLFIGIGFHQKMPGFWQGCVISALLGLFAATFLLLFLMTAIQLYLGITSSIMLAWDRDLRRKVNYRPEAPRPVVQRPPAKLSVVNYIVIAYFVLMLLSGLVKYMSSRPR